MVMQSYVKTAALLGMPSRIDFTVEVEKVTAALSDNAFFSVVAPLFAVKAGVRIFEKMMPLEYRKKRRRIRAARGTAQGRKLRNHYISRGRLSRHIQR